MNARWLQPNPSSDLHWGFLDKFAMNEYLPRAFLLATLATLAVAVALNGRRSIDAVPQLKLQFTTPVDFGPTPTITLRVVPMPVHSQPRLRSALERIRPVPEPIADATDPVAANTGASASGIGASAPGATDDEQGFGSGVTESTWPSPEDYVPVEHEPVLVTMQSPAYPELARDAGIDGTVLVRVLVGEDGFVHQALVLQSVLGLDEAALAAARTAVFRAALQQERPVAVWIVVPIEFQLH